MTNKIAVPLPNVSGPILTKVIEYCTHHRDDPNFLSANDDVAADIDEWDLEYCKVDQGTLYELILVKMAGFFSFFVALSSCGSSWLQTISNH